LAPPHIWNEWRTDATLSDVETTPIEERFASPIAGDGLSRGDADRGDDLAIRGEFVI
jgi:hypothetical protein